MVLIALASQTQAMRLCNFFCPMMLDEVCGTDGQTYGKILPNSDNFSIFDFDMVNLSWLEIISNPETSRLKRLV